MFLIAGDGNTKGKKIQNKPVLNRPSLGTQNFGIGKKNQIAGESEVDVIRESPQV